MKATKLTRATLAAAVAAATALPLGAEAASSSNIGPALITTPVNLNFSVAVPRFVFLRVGSAVPATVNTLVYAPTPTEIVNNTGVLATGGDIAPSDVTVQVVGNGGGSVTLTAVTGAPNLVSGGNNMPWSTLTATNPTGTVAAPPFNVGNSVVPAASGVVNQTGSWRYTWNNGATIYPSGTYTGTVTYTASMP